MSERQQQDSGRLVLRLYVAGSSPNSLQAITNLRKALDARVHGRYTLEVVDVLLEPRRSANGIPVTPTLVCLSPKPIRMVVGNLSRTEVLLHALGLGDEPDNPDTD